MKIIVPLAKTSSREKIFDPLLKVGEKTFLERTVDILLNIKASEIIFIVGENYKEIIKLLTNKYKNNNFRFIRQKKKKGAAHAIYGAKKAFKQDEDVLIVYGDGFLTKDMIKIINKKEKPKTNIIWTYNKEDEFNKYGVVFVQEGKITKLIEKPEIPISTLIMTGIYYIKDSSKLFNAIKTLIDKGITHNGEYNLTYALQIMINEGQTFVPEIIKVWYDLEVEEELLRAQEYILEKEYGRKTIQRDLKKNVILVPPVYVAKSASVYNAIIGPNVTVDEHAVIENCIIIDSIIGEKAVIENMKLSNSIIGKNSHVKSGFMNLKLPPNTRFQVDKK